MKRVKKFHSPHFSLLTEILISLPPLRKNLLPPSTKAINLELKPSSLDTKTQPFLLSFVLSIKVWKVSFHLLDPLPLANPLSHPIVFVIGFYLTFI